MISKKAEQSLASALLVLDQQLDLETSLECHLEREALRREEFGEVNACADLAEFVTQRSTLGAELQDIYGGQAVDVALLCEKHENAVREHLAFSEEIALSAQDLQGLEAAIEDSRNCTVAEVAARSTVEAEGV